MVLKGAQMKSRTLGWGALRARNTMEIANKAVRIRLSDFRTPQMRAFHLTWFAFFLCFFGWFGIAPLMVIVREQLALTKAQIGNTIIASVAITVFARLFIGWLCDRIGPRKAYTGLLILGSIPVASIGFANSYETFLLARLAIGVIGASFVVTQYHTSLMFAPNVVGTANATTAGWGNLGGGVTQMVMPLVLTMVTTLGVSSYYGWRVAMIVPAVAMLLTAVAYWRLTQDCPDGNLAELRAAGKLPPAEEKNGASFLEAARDGRVWALFVLYAACFGVELTINNVAALYFHDYFGLSVATAGVVAGLFGLMNLFARTLGGVFGDRAGARYGLKGRVGFLGAVVFLEGLALMAFSRMSVLPVAIVMLVVFSLFVQMSEGATFSVVPMLNKRALGSISGIVGAGGNAGAVAAGFLFRSESIDTPTALLYLGVAVTVSSSFAALVRFSPAQVAQADAEMKQALAQRDAQGAGTGDLATSPAE
jgi:MFS transporter, NNP family, nitrate/nitrite transporter